MTLAISATQLDFVQVQIDVTGAATYTNKYTGNFSSGVDGWTSATDGAHSAPAGPDYSAYSGHLYIYGMHYSDQYTYKTLTGLTVGHTYRFSLNVHCYNGSGLLYLSIATIGDSEPTAISKGGPTWTTMEYTFTATSTSHQLRIRRADESVPTFGLEFDDVLVDDLGSAETNAVTISRYDGNDYGFVRLADGQVPNSSGALTVIDEEWLASEYSSWDVTYQVTTASGDSASATITPAVLNSNLIIPVGYLGQSIGVGRVNVFDESNDFTQASNVLTIMGKNEPINISGEEEDEPSAWQLRSGTIEYWAQDYASAQGIVDLYTDGRVMALKNMSVGIMYHIASSIEIRNDIFRINNDFPEGAWTWAVSVSYQEVNNPDSTLQGAFGYAYSDVFEDYLAYYNLPIEFSTYADLAVGP